HSASPACGDHVFGPQRVRIVEEFPRPPDARDRGGVKHGMNTLARAIDRGRVANVSLDTIDSKCREVRIRAAGANSHPMATCDELFDDVSAEEPSAACHKSQHA